MALRRGTAALHQNSALRKSAIRLWPETWAAWKKISTHPQQHRQVRDVGEHSGNVAHLYTNISRVFSNTNSQ